MLLGARAPSYRQVLREMLALFDANEIDSQEEAILSRLEAAWRSRTFPAYYDRPALLL